MAIIELTPWQYRAEDFEKRIKELEDDIINLTHKVEKLDQQLYEHTHNLVLTTGTLTRYGIHTKE